LIRVQISFEEKEYALVTREAKTLGISMAELVRRAVRQTLPARGTAPWMRYIGFVESGDPDSSRKIDELVYRSKIR
jgi:ribbon-helix-helix CopG family protein